MILRPKHKFYALIATGVVLLFLSYPLAVKKTLAAKKAYNELRQRSEFTKELPRNLALLERKDQLFDSIISQMKLGSTSAQNNLIKFIHEHDSLNRLKIVELRKPHIAQQENHQISTFQFTLRGSYLDILKALYAFEQGANFGEIVHVDFEKKRNYKTNKDFLEATVFIQRIE